MTSSDESIIRSLAEQLRAAEERGDPGPLTAAIAPDVVILAPGNPALEGAAQCLEFIRTVMADVKLEFVRHSLTHHIIEVRMHGDIAIDRGTFKQTLTPAGGGDDVVTEGHFLRVYARDRGGAWKVSRVIWNHLDQDEAPEAFAELPDD
jgi:ketosteroid isomerase-like protein